MVGSDSLYTIHVFRNAWRRDRTRKPSYLFRIIVLILSGFQPFSPGKMIFTGIGVLLAVSFQVQSNFLVAHDLNIHTHRRRGMWWRTIRHSPTSLNGFTSSFNA